MSLLQTFQVPHSHRDDTLSSGDGGQTLYKAFVEHWEHCFNKIFALGEFFSGTKYISKSSYFYEGGEVVTVWKFRFMLSYFLV